MFPCLDDRRAMTTAYTHRRSSPRALVLCPIAVTFRSSTIHGIVRDISEQGIFFYLNSRPELNSNISFTVRMPNKHVTGTGEVIRLEQAAPGAAVGVAIRISASHHTALE